MPNVTPRDHTHNSDDAETARGGANPFVKMRNSLHADPSVMTGEPEPETDRVVLASRIRRAMASVARTMKDAEDILTGMRHLGRAELPCPIFGFPLTPRGEG